MFCAHLLQINSNHTINSGEEILESDKSGLEEKVPILGLYKSTGNIVLYGDSNCLDSNHMEIGIFNLNT